MDKNIRKEFLEVSIMWFIGILLFGMVLFGISLIPMDEASAMDFKEYINTPIVTEQNKTELRIEWHNFLGIDVFQPYFVIKDVEDGLVKKATLRIFNFTGRPEIKDTYHKIEYVFRYKF
jgi:hypothetical protein